MTWQDPQDRLTEARVDNMRQRNIADRLVELIHANPDFYWSPVTAVRRFHGKVRVEFACGEAFNIECWNMTGKEPEEVA